MAPVDRFKYLIVLALLVFIYYKVFVPAGEILAFKPAPIVLSKIVSIRDPILDPQLLQRVFALGDIHGDFNTALSLLERGGIVDKNHNWIAGKDVFVQTVILKMTHIHYTIKIDHDYINPG